MIAYTTYVVSRRVLILATLLVASFFVSTIVNAQEGCGSIIEPRDFANQDGPMVTRAISDCNDPFLVTTEPVSPYRLVIDGQVYDNNAVVVLPSGETNRISVLGQSGLSGNRLALYKHEEGNYRFVPLYASDITRTDYVNHARTFFTTESDRNLYLEIWDYTYENGRADIYFYDEEGNNIIDVTTGEYVVDRYNSFVNSVSKPDPMIGEGTYTLLITEFLLILNKENLLQKFANMLIPVAHAQFADGSSDNRYTITFTITKEVPAPKGASSVLFLPGIMGSHLYEKGQQCGDFGEEQQRWFSISDCEQQRLFLDENGNSVYDIYSKVTDEGIIEDIAYGAADNLYANFIEKMNDLEGNVITDFVPFPYDWRLRLEHQLLTTKNENNEVRYKPGISYEDGLLYTTIAAMADTSKSGKVTLVAHSNGGLVIKTLMQKLQSENDPLLTKIDNIILVGSPQVGTPDAIVGVLHGAEIGGGWVVSQETARALLNNAPFGYHLLPNQHYYDGVGVSVDTPVIVFDAGTTTIGFITRYGNSIDSFTELQTFMGSASSRLQPNPYDLYTPEVGNDALLEYREQIADVMADWTPASTTQVYQIAGTGMWTPKTLRYFSGEICTRYVPVLGTCTTYMPQLQHQTYFTRDGDGTVVVPSAVAMEEAENVKRYWLDLEKYSVIKEEEFIHKHMMEVDDIATFVTTVASGTKPTETAYIKTSSPTTVDEHHLVFHLHSPLDMYVASDQGVLSSTTNTIPGAMYRRFGEVQYVIVPADITNAVLHLVGYKEGSFTLIKEEWVGASTTVVSDYRAIPTGTSTRVRLDLVAGEELKVDMDGNGSIDGIVRAEADALEMLATSPVPVIDTRDSSTQGSRSTATRLLQPLPNGLVAGTSTTAELQQMERVIQMLQTIISLLVQLKTYEKK